MNPSQSNSNLASTSSASNRLIDAWYQKRWWLWLLSPLSLLFYLLTTARRLFLLSPLVKKNQFSVPIIVVGNISVGGTGKTPLIIALCEHLKKQGYRPGVISRGYGSAAPCYPFVVDQESSVEESGDEPLMIAIATQCPVVIDRNRCAAAKKIIETCDVNIVLSDDGLQHYRLARDIEIVVVDGARGFGNGLVLPAGPLRETANRLKRVDFVVANQSSVIPCNIDSRQLSAENKFTAMKIIPEYWCHLNASHRKISISSDLFSGENVHAVSGIGNPKRFYSTLDTLGINYQPHSFPDHHQYINDDFRFDDDNKPILMTEKDAVKVRGIISDSKNNYWYLAVKAELDLSFLSQLQENLSHLSRTKK
ncbi:MAG: tetraacyldisaccharide 4'-kinase [Cellvibrionaceae bacterium]